MVPLLGKDLVHAVVSYGHGHTIGRVGVPDRAPGRKADGDGLPAAIEAQVTGRIYVDGKVRFDGEAVQIDVVA